MKEIEFIPFIKQGRLTDTCQCSRLGRRMNGGKLLFRTTPANIRGRHSRAELGRPRNRVGNCIYGKCQPPPNFIISRNKILFPTAKALDRNVKI